MSTEPDSGKIELSYSDRLILLGDSNSGKSYCAERIARAYKRVVVISADPSEFQGFPTRIITTDPNKVRETLQKAYETGNCFVVIDDSDNFFNRFESEQETRNFLIMSRHRRVAWAIIARRPTDLPALCFFQANRHFIWQTNHPREIELYDSYFQPGSGEKIRALDRNAHHFYYYDRDSRVEKIAVV